MILAFNDWEIASLLGPEDWLETKAVDAVGAVLRIGQGRQGSAHPSPSNCT